MNRLYILCSLLALSLVSCVPPNSALLLDHPAWAGGKKPKQTPASTQRLQGKPVIHVAVIENVRIELPNEQFYDFGDFFRQKLKNHLMDKFVVFDPAHSALLRKSAESLRSDAPSDDTDWENSGAVPAAVVRIHVDALSFSTGARGTRMFYGFDERMRNPFNDGSAQMANEFPLDTLFGEPNWFDHHFDRKGIIPFDSLSGLDLGEGFSIDVLFAYLNIKYASYRSKLNLSIEVDAPLANRHDYRTVQVQGRGFFYDVAAAYGQWNAGLRLARATAMKEAVTEAFDSTLSAIDRSTAGLPLTAIVDHVGLDGTIYLGTGEDANIPSGTLYQSLDHENLILRVERSVHSGSIARVAQGDFSLVQPKMLFLETPGLPHPTALASLSASPSANSRAPLKTFSSLRSVVAEKTGAEPLLSASESVSLPTRNLAEADGLGNIIPKISRWVAFLQSLRDTVTLPYRIWRYFQYDKSYHAQADGRSQNNTPDTLDPSAPQYSRTPELPAPEPDPQGPIVAIIDTGVDYNHPAIHGSIWLNPHPVADSTGKQDRYGWDFISGDPRAVDDAYHGTELASLVLSQAPHARIMPLKVFNPWGVTQSAALYEAFRYAVDHGADLILTGWSTRRKTVALDSAVGYAQTHGVPIIAAAGDLSVSIRQVATYPASLAYKYDNVLSVAALDGTGALWKNSNFESSLVHVAALGVNLTVAEPRARTTELSSTAAAAARTAGLLARLMKQSGQKIDIHALIASEAKSDPRLNSFIHDGLVLPESSFIHR